MPSRPNHLQGILDCHHTLGRGMYLPGHNLVLSGSDISFIVRFNPTNSARSCVIPTSTPTRLPISEASLPTSLTSMRFTSVSRSAVRALLSLTVLPLSSRVSTLPLTRTASPWQTRPPLLPLSAVTNTSLVCLIISLSIYPVSNMTYIL